VPEEEQEPAKRRRGSRPADESGRKRRRPPPTEENALARFGINHGQERWIKIITVAVSVVIGAVALTVAVTSLGGGGVSVGESGSPSEVRQARPEAYQGWRSPKLFAPIATRETDAKALSTKEVFGKTLKSGNITLKLASSRLDDGCASVVWGEFLTGKLAEAECDQALRGLYLSADKRYVAQYTLFNLRDTQAADGLVEALKTEHRGGWVQALPAAKAALPPEGYTEASGHAMGHYAGLVWMARADGAELTPADDFVTLSLAVRGAEKAVYRRVVAVTGPSAKPSQ
jgi:hypothetical protein